MRSTAISPASRHPTVLLLSRRVAGERSCFRSICPKAEMWLNPKPVITFGDVHERLVLDIDKLSEFHRIVTMEILPQFDRFFA